MKKALCILLSIVMLLSGSVFAAPVIDTVESTAEIEVLMDEKTSDAALMASGVKPGVNMLNQSEALWTFEGDYSGLGPLTPKNTYLSEAPETLTSTAGGGNTFVYTNPYTNGINTSEKALVNYMYWPSTSTGQRFPGVNFTLSTSIESDRPVWVTYKYLKKFVTTSTGKLADAVDSPTTGFNVDNNLWVMKNGSTYIAKPINGFAVSDTWKMYSGVIDFNKALKAGTSNVYDTNPITQININSAQNKADGYYLCYFDDIAYVPSYKITYMANDGTDTEVTHEYVLFPEGTTQYSFDEIVSSYTVNNTVKPGERYRYNFLGWSRNPNATTVAEAETDIALENQDVVLYAIWDLDETLPEATTVKWDFENSDSQSWYKANTGYSYEYKNGMLVVNTTASAYSGTPHIKHYGKGNANDNVLANAESLNTKALKYFVVKARSLGEAEELELYVKTSENGWEGAEGKGMNKIPMDANSKVFKEYIFDMSDFSNWSGDYQDCMLKLNGASYVSGGDNSKGIVEIEEMYFTTVYEFPDETQAAEYHYDLSGSKSYNRFGNTAFISNGDGTYKAIKSSYTLNPDGTPTTTSNSQGAFYTYSVASAGLDTSVYKNLVLKTKNADGITGFVAYYTTSTLTNYQGTARDSTSLLGTDKSGYSYHVVDFSAMNSYTGTVTAFMIQPSGNGTVDVCDIYLTNKIDLDLETEVEIEKIALYSTSDKITTDEATVTLNPYVRYSDGSEMKDFSDIYYVTDSVNAQIVKNSDGTVTVKGKINGKVNITATIPNLDARISKQISISGQSDRFAATSLKVMMFGNSIRSHGYNETNFPYTDKRGMAASSLENDYAHRFVYYLDQKYGEGTAELISSTSVATFERSISGKGNTYDFTNGIATFVKEVKEAQPDIISIQIGENVTNATQAEYENAMGQLYEGIKAVAPENAIIVLCTPFWNSAYKVNGMTSVADEYDLPLARLHTLDTDENKAYKNAEGWFLPESASTGVEAHPGDTGMDNIAKLIFEQANIILSANEPTEYTLIPDTLEITADSNVITTENGTLQLTANVFPAGAASDVVWSVSNENIAAINENGLVTAINNTVNEPITVTAKSKYMNTVYDTFDITITGQAACHTVTYNKNTTDQVTNLPEANIYAKGEFEFDDVYPVRSTYKFLGWSTEPNGAVVDKITITDDITVYAQWEKAFRWYFETDGFKEEFYAVNGFNEYVLDGVYMSIATGTNVATGEVLKFVSPVLDLKAEDYHSLVITMQNTFVGADTKLELTVKTTNGDVKYTKNVTSTTFTEYEFILDEATGTITGFEFTPTNIDCTVNIESIKFITVPVLTYDANTDDENVANMPSGGSEDETGIVNLSAAIPSRNGYTFLGWANKADSKLLIDGPVEASVDAPVTVYAVWDKNDHWEFTSEKDVSSTTNVDEWSVKDGVLTLTENGYDSLDIIVSLAGNKNYTVDPSMSAIIKARQTDFPSEQSSQLFYWTSATGTSGASGSYVAPVSEKIPSGSSETFNEYTIPFANHSKFSGTLGGLRFDPFQCTGTLEIDYVRFNNSEANIVVENGEARKVETDWATYIVRNGAVIAPQGATELASLRLSGDIDMTSGYMTVSGVVEIADNSEYAAFTLNSAALGAEPGEYMYISGYDNPVTIVDGTKYIVKLTDGVGYIYLGDETGADKQVVYKVTKNTLEKKIDETITLAKPVAGAKPQTTIETSEYTATVSWMPSVDSVFAYGTEYTATVTITPASGYTTSGVKANGYAVANSASVVNIADSNVVTVSYSPTAMPARISNVITLTAPTANDRPQTSVSGEGYTGTVVWAPEVNEKFAFSTIYTATITLSTDAAYTTAGIAENGYTVEGAERVVNAADSNVIIITYEATGDKPCINNNIVLATPVAKETPQTTIVTDEYTAAVEWSPAVTDTFDYNTVYTATVTITPGDDYSTIGIAENGYIFDGAYSVTNAANSNIVTVSYPITSSKPAISTAIELAAPSLNAVPVTSIDTEEYTATVEWSAEGVEDIASFERGVVYTATVTITPKGDYTTVGNGENSYTVAGATSVTNEPDSNVVIVLFPAIAISGSNMNVVSSGWFDKDKDTEISDEHDKSDNSETENADEDDKFDDIKTPDNSENEWSNSFVDVSENDWYYDAVKYVMQNGLCKGTAETEFSPNSSLTRAMLVTVLWRAESEPETTYDSMFEDVESGAYYEKAVEWAAENGIVNGISESEFAPDNNILREQIASILYRYAAYKNYDISESADISKYNDAQTVSDYAVASVKWSVAVGVLNGKSEITLNPTDNATRAEAAAMLQRFLELIK